MAHKQLLFISLFLISCTIAAKNTITFSINIALQIQELEKKIEQKELEIFNLGSSIEEKDKLFSQLKVEIQKNIEAMIHARTEQLKKQNNDKSLSQEEKNNIDIQVRNELKELISNFFEDINNNKNINGSLAEEICPQDKIDYGFFKFHLIRSMLDYQFIVNLINKYQHYIKELTELKNELINLQKQRELL